MTGAGARWPSRPTPTWGTARDRIRRREPAAGAPGTGPLASRICPAPRPGVLARPGAATAGIACPAVGRRATC